MQCPSVISYPAEVPSKCPLPSSDLFNQVCDFCLCQKFVFLSWRVTFSILLSIYVSAAASLFFAWMVSAHVSAPYAIAGSTHELQTCSFKHVIIIITIIIIITSFAPISSKIKLTGATKPRD